jgi:hypothetical protein
MIFKISNLNKNIFFYEIYDLLSVFGEISGFLAEDDFFIFKFSNLKFNLLNLDYLSLGGKRLRIVKSKEYDYGFDCLPSNEQYLLLKNISLEDIKNECIRYGSIEEVYEENGKIKVKCTSKEDLKMIFRHLYGRFYKNRRVRVKLC